MYSWCATRFSFVVVYDHDLQAALFVRKSKIDDGEAAVVGTPVERFASTSHGLYMYMALVVRCCFSHSLTKFKADRNAWRVFSC